MGFEKMSQLQLVHLAVQMQRTLQRHIAIQEALGQTLMDKQVEIERLAGLLGVAVQQGERAGLEVEARAFSEFVEHFKVSVTHPSPERDSYIVMVEAQAQGALEPEPPVLAAESCDRNPACMLPAHHDGDCLERPQTELPS